MESIAKDVMEHQAPYMIDFRNGKEQVYFEKMWQAGLLEYDNEKGLELGMASH